MSVLDALHVLEQRMVAAQLILLREIDGRGLGRRLGGASSAAWLRNRHRLAPATASRRVRLAAALDADLPRTAAALVDGEINVEQAQAIADAVGKLPSGLRGEGEQRLLAHTDRADPRADPRMLAAAGARLLEDLDPQEAERQAGAREARLAARAHRARDFRLIDVPGTGLVRVAGQLDQESAAVSAMDPRGASRRPTWCAVRWGACRATLALMPGGRDDIPNELERALMMEAGYRCIIPRCRAVAPLQIDHIVDYARVRVHEFDNMIVLCANCHGLKGERPRKIDRKALRGFKANLRIINCRYSAIELRILEYFARFPDQHLVRLPGGMNVFVLPLVSDGVIEPRRHVDDPWSDLHVDEQTMELNPYPDIYELTPDGRLFVQMWTTAEPLEGWKTQR